MKHKREFEWVGAQPFPLDVTATLLTFIELPVAGSPAGIGGVTTGTPTTPLVDVLFHRVLMDIQIGLISRDTSSPAAGTPLSWLSIGLLLTEWDDTNVAPVLFDPSNPEENLDAEWLWRMNIPLHNDGVQAVLYEAQHPSVPMRYDLAIRGGRGSRATEKRRCYAWVFTIDTDLAQLHCQVGFTASYLYSATK